MSSYADAHPMKPQTKIEGQRAETPFGLIVARLALAGGIVGVAFAGIFEPAGLQHRVTFDLIAAVIGIVLAGTFAGFFASKIYRGQ
jgi:hypothetical protein